MKSSLRMSNDDNNIPKLARDTMKQPMQRGLQGVFALSGALMASMIKPEPAFAFGKLEDANTKLGLYELPPIIFVPPGFSPLVSEFGRGNIREKMTNPLLIQFCHPQLWVEAVTSYNLNGEAGTISANDYIKGDSAFFYFRPLAEGQILSVNSKDLIKEFILKSLSQKGDPVETFKIVSVKQGNKGVDGQEYITAEINYTINTEAGFLIGRKGIASLTSVGPFIQGLVAVVIDKRWKDKAETIRDVIASFKVYKLNSGIFAAFQEKENAKQALMPLNKDEGDKLKKRVDELKY
eukprot:CAMPEP_0119037702 /NCGR_PEP_ID=MMETSP1177-20130426/6196_1 /TAXON_ID=2985 /ORGANISM="Ochromonas sp, Strain CCMP1899" /LENGTH=292 /DNA_ID=CAMNT_0006999321 /DNA_START=148 /DNA_END=1026 /DNA_ORIENTATION=-